MRQKFRGRAVLQKETAVDPTPVRFPDSYEQRNRIEQAHHVRISRLKVYFRSTALIYNIDRFDRL